MRVIDIRDPYTPRRWRAGRRRAGSRPAMLHDIDVKDGWPTSATGTTAWSFSTSATAMKGGSPEKPQLVSQYKYDLNALYRERRGGGRPRLHPRHPHRLAGRQLRVRGRRGLLGQAQADRRRRGDRPGPRLRAAARDRRLRSRGPARSGLLRAARTVAVHNVWVAGDTLYMGDYQGGLRVLDISGELRGDLQAQGREIAHAVTGDARGACRTPPMPGARSTATATSTCPDINSGLWIVKVDGAPAVTP